MKKKIYSLLMLAMAAFAFTSCEDVPMPYDNPNEASRESEGDNYGEASGSGTLADPYNTAAILKLTSSLAAGEESAEQYYFKGKVVSIEEEFGTQFGNATFYISDDGTSTNQFYVFQALYLGNKKYTSGTNIKIGDEVIIWGKVTNYKGNTPETVRGSAYVYSINGETGGNAPAGDAKGTGTQADPFNVAAAIAKCKEIGTDPSTEKYYVKGIAQGNATADASYNNITFDIADTDGGAQFTCYQVAGTDGKPLPSGFSIKKGDEVVVYGPIYNYKGNTPETAGKSAAYIVTVNGKATGEGGGGGETPSTDAKKVTVAEFNAAEVNDNVWYQLTGTVENLKDGDQYGNFDLKDETGSVYVYGLLSEKGGEKKKFQDLAAAKGIKNGSKITIIGTRGVFNDKIEVLNAYFVSIEGGGGSGEQGGGSQVSGNSITFSEQGYQNQQDFDGQSITLGDAKLSFSKGSGSTTPKYYSTGTAMRLYGGNTLTISSSKTISKVEFTYAEDYNGTSYYPTADNSTVTPGTYDYSTHTWTGSANEIVLSRSASTGHFRIVSITITYAK